MNDNKSTGVDNRSKRISHSKRLNSSKRQSGIESRNLCPRAVLDEEAPADEVVGGFSRDDREARVDRGRDELANEPDHQKRQSKDICEKKQLTEIII